MVRYHYALVDDLITWEEFDHRIEEKISACGNLVDEIAAALLVVKDLGRSHVKIKGLIGRSSLFCFYAKVIAFSGVKEFDRQSGEKGLVARLTVADETGQAELVLWDEQAAGVEDAFEIGEVIEVIGKHGKSKREIQPLNMRRTPVEITCGTDLKERKVPERRDTHLMVIRLDPSRPFTRKDGTVGELVTGLAGDAGGTARLICWEPEILSGIVSGQALMVSQMMEKEGDYGGREFVLDDQTDVIVAESLPKIPYTPLNEVMPDQTVTVTGRIMHVQPVKQFIRRDGATAFVRNVRISDGTGELPLVLWEDLAKQPIIMDEKILIYHAQARTNRYGDTEISVGRGSTFMVLPEEDGEKVQVEGFILRLPDGVIIDTGMNSYLVETDLPHGTIAEMNGFVSNGRLFRESEKVLELDLDVVKKQVKAFIQDLE